MNPSQPTNRLVEDHAALILIIAGAAFITLGALSDEPALAAPLAVMGAATIILGALFSRIQGPIRIGPGGLEAVLTAVDNETKTRGLTPPERDRVFAAATREALALANSGGIPTGETFSPPAVAKRRPAEQEKEPGKGPEPAQALPEPLVQAFAVLLVDKHVEPVTGANAQPDPVTPGPR